LAAKGKSKRNQQALKRLPARKGKGVRKRRKPSARPRPPLHYRTLIAILMLLYMLRLIDEKTFKRIQAGLYPAKPARKKRAQGRMRRRAK